MDINFIKKNDNTYIAKYNNELEQFVNKTINDITNNKSELFFEQNNKYLIDIILSRVVSTIFIEKGLAIPDIGFVVIEMEYMERNVIISLGLLNYAEKKEYVCGILNSNF